MSRVSRSSDDGEAPARPIRVLPDGSASLLVTWAPNGVELEVFGPHSTAFEVWDREPVDKLELKLRPGAISQLLGIAARELRDRRVPLAAICGSDAERGRRRFEDATEASWDERLAGVGAWIRGRLGEERAPIDDALRLALDEANGSRGAARVGELVRCARIGERRLERLFDRHVGLSPKRYLRLVRFRHAVLRLETGTPAAEVAAEGGFADQAHLTREVHTFAGVPPGGLG